MNGRTHSRASPTPKGKGAIRRGKLGGFNWGGSEATSSSSAKFEKRGRNSFRNHAGAEQKDKGRKEVKQALLPKLWLLK